MDELFTKAKILNHLNFSGMNFDKDNLLKFCASMRKIKFLMGAHLNDNGIMHDHQTMMKIVHIFGMSDADIPESKKIGIARPGSNFDDINKPEPGFNYKAEVSLD